MAILTRGFFMCDLYDLCHRLFSYDPETGLLTRKVSVGKTKVGDVVGYVSDRGYVRFTIDNKCRLSHRIIWLMVTGYLPKEHIDHINCDKTDNRWVNLREATHSENQRNRGKNKNNKTGFKGVLLDKRNKKNPYEARIAVDGKLTCLGRYPTSELAYEAYCHASKELHGKFARA